jgi:GNAT superfamily N-acetyltransferase
MGPDGDLVHARLERGCTCFAAWTDGELAAYGWLSSGPEWIGEIQLELKPREREAYIWNCVTLPQHRRKGVFRALVGGMSVAARRLGARRVWIGSVAIPAERALQPLGFKPALIFDTAVVAGLHVMRVGLAGDRQLAADAASALRVRPGLVIRRSQRRRH